MLDAAMSRELQQIEMPDQVGLNIGMRVFERIAHARLRAEMDDPVESLVVERGHQRSMVGEIETKHGEAAIRLAFDLREPILLQAGSNNSR